MAKLCHMDNIIWQPEGEPVDLVKSLVAIAFPSLDERDVETANWLRELEYAPNHQFAVTQVDTEYIGRSRESDTEKETYMVTGSPGQPEGTVCYIAVIVSNQGDVMEDGVFAFYYFVRPRVTVEFV